jgi:CheY-like chemotaxis protein
MLRSIPEAQRGRTRESTNGPGMATNRGDGRASGLLPVGGYSNNEMPVLHEKNADRLARPRSGSDHRASRIRSVLVVEDDVDVAAALAGLLQAWGYHVTVAHDGPAALAAMQDILPDIALVDIGLPAMDGYEFAAHLRFHPGCEELPIVAITGAGAPKDIRHSLARGFTAHLVKPVSAASLRALLK